MSINNLNTYLNIKDSHLRVVSGNVYAQAMNIGGINVETAHGLQSVSNTGNVTSNTLQFSNAITGFVTTANAQIGRDLVVSGNTTVSTDLTVSANATVADTLTISEHLIASKEATITGNLHVTTIRSDSNVVTEYTGPHDRPLRKYPEVALTAASQGGYIVTQSNQDTVNSYFAYKAFNEIKGAPAAGTDIWYSGGLSHYNTSDGSAVLSGSDIAPRLDTNTDYGEWIGLELPKPIKLDSFKLWRQFNFQNHHPVSATLYAKKTSSDSWTEIYRYDDIDVRQGDTPGQFNVNSQIFYKFFAFVGRKRSQGVASVDGISLAELEYYGHEEGSGSLDTTLKTVYNVPATTGTQLEVYYDGQDYSDIPTVGSASVTDKAGGDQNGTPGIGVGFDTTYKAFTFNGATTASISGTHGLGTGTGIQYSMSLWFKADVLSGNHRLATFGTQGTQYQSSSLLIYQNDIHLDHWTSEMKTTSDILVSNVWYHLVATHTGPGTNDVSQNALYLNGVKLENVTTGGSAGNGTFNLQGTGLTIGADSAGTNPFNGSIANFRLYSKALNADQIKELYDYQKDYFLGSKSQVTLYKGHLGVGVTEPSGQLELAGDERIQEYPPRALRQYTTHVEGHGVFTVRASAELNQTGDNDRAWKMFTKIADNSNYWTPTGGTTTYGYSSSDGYTTAYHETAGVKGHWVQLQLPYKIKLHSVKIAAGGISTRQAKDATVFGSNDGGNTWTSVGGWTDNNVDDFTLVTFSMNNVGYYSLYRLVITRNGGNDAITLTELQFFGTPGPTTLDKGSLTLGRSLDVPRISRYDVDTETPRPEKLVLDFDTTVNSSPTDISGKGNHGVFYGTASYSAPDKAFTGFPSSSSNYIKATLNGASGAYAHTQSYWINGADTTPRCAFTVGTNTGTYSYLYMWLNTSKWVMSVDGFGFQYVETIDDNRWYHITVTYDGGSVQDSYKFYLNGEYKTPTSVDNASSFNSLNLPSNPEVRIGRDDNVQWYNGMVSNPKIYSVALEPSEVRKLYNLGRTGQSMVISDTAVGIGKAPEAQLDVRGTISATSDIQINSADGISKIRTGKIGMFFQNGGRTIDIDTKFSPTRPYSIWESNVGDEGSYIAINADNVVMCTPCDDESLRYYDEDNGNEVWNISNAGALVVGSDSRRKHDIKPVIWENVLKKIGNIEPSTFKFKHPELYTRVTSKWDKEHIGFIAQNVQENFPELVTEDGSSENYLLVNSSMMILPIIQGIQQLTNELEAEKAKNETLELRIENNRLKNKVTILENRQTHFNTLLVNLIGRIETLERPT